MYMGPFFISSSDDDENIDICATTGAEKITIKKSEIPLLIALLNGVEAPVEEIAATYTLTDEDEAMIEQQLANEQPIAHIQ